MTTPKTETLTVRLAPEIKDSLRNAAAQEHRSLANMLEVMIRDWCGVSLSPRRPRSARLCLRADRASPQTLFGYAQSQR